MLEVLIARRHRMRILTTRINSCCFKGWKLPRALVLLNVVLTAWAEFACIKCLLGLDLGLTGEEIALFLPLFYDQHWASCIIISENRLSCQALLRFTDRYLLLHLYFKEMALWFTCLSNNWLLPVVIVCIKTICFSADMLHFSFSKGHITQVSIVSSLRPSYRQAKFPQSV